MPDLIASPEYAAAFGDYLRTGDPLLLAGFADATTGGFPVPRALENSIHLAMLRIPRTTNAVRQVVWACPVCRRNHRLGSDIATYHIARMRAA